MPDVKQTNHAGAIALTIVAICLLAEVWVRLSTVVADAREGSRTEQSELSYTSKWQPARAGENGNPPVYYPGESVFFHTTRHVKFAGRDMLPLLVASSILSEDNGAEYGLPPVARILTTEGELKLDTVRVLPTAIPPGRYRIVGWAKTETDRRPTFAVFESEVIEVRAISK